MTVMIKFTEFCISSYFNWGCIILVFDTILDAAFVGYWDIMLYLDLWFIHIFSGVLWRSPHHKKKNEYLYDYDYNVN